MLSRLLLNIIISPIVKANKKLSSDEHLFKSAKDLYNKALKNSGYKQNIKFQHNVFVKKKQ